MRQIGLIKHLYCQQTRFHYIHLLILDSSHMQRQILTSAADQPSSMIGSSSYLDIAKASFKSKADVKLIQGYF